MTLNIIVSLFAVAGFAAALFWTRIVSVARNALATSMTGLSTMMDSDLDDDTKETAVQATGLALIKASFGILWRVLVALAAAAAPMFIADAIGLVEMDDVLALMLRLDYLVIVSVGAIAIVMVVSRFRRGSKDAGSSGTSYSATDRFFHIIAFSGPGVLKFISRIEDRLTKAPTRAPSAPPIFITALARGGTTALLNALHDVDGIATHRYRDMPFLTAPSLWYRLSGGKKRAVERHQRAHGDGLEIDLDSPEAFEEVVWKMFWPQKFRQRMIAPWQTSDRKPDADQFLERHMSKVIQARVTQSGEDTADSARYCSKNNANIARIAYLKESFPGCHIVVPVRRPESHAASLLRQHENFLKQHADDDFIKRYMRDIGHFEFGQIQKLISFPGVDPDAYDAATPDYWLNYWIQAYRVILSESANCHFILQDDLRAKPQATMTTLCRNLDLSADEMAFDTYFRSSTDSTDTSVFDPALLKEAADLYDQFKANAATIKG